MKRREARPLEDKAPPVFGRSGIKRRKIQIPLLAKLRRGARESLRQQNLLPPKF